MTAAPAGPRQVRVTYWTGWLSPEMEGCSKEVFALQGHFPRSRVFGLSNAYTLRASWRQRFLGLGMNLYPLFRALAPLWDASSDVNHIYGGLSEWFFLRALRLKPQVMTIAAETEPLDSALYRHVRYFVTHSRATSRLLIQSGFDASRIRLIYPGIDLRRFEPAPRDRAPLPAWPDLDPARFRILFASTPDRIDGLESRGVNLLLEAASQMPEVDFLVPWRPWATGRRFADECRRRAPPNVHISLELVPDMRRLFHSVDATIAPFLDRDWMKLCPTSLVESLACGRPVLVSSIVGISDLVGEDQCGAVFEPTVSGLCDGVRLLRARYETFAANARATAERHFDQVECFQHHEHLYQEVLVHRAEAS